MGLFALLQEIGNNEGNGGGLTPESQPHPNDPPCDPSVPTSPQPGMTDPNGCPTVVPTILDLGDPKTPCEKISEQRNDEQFNKRIDTLKANVNLKKETGYIQKFGGSYVYKDNATATDEKNSLTLPSLATNTYIKGFFHTHVKDFKYYDQEGYEKMNYGIKIFSPGDVSYFMDIVKNAQNKGVPLTDVYGGMVSGMKDYQLRFTGTQYQIKTFTDDELKMHTEPFVEFMRPFLKDSKMLEFLMLKYFDENMLIKGITLYRMNNDGTTTAIKLNQNKTDTTETDCPN